MKRIHIAIIMTMVIGFTGCSKTADSNSIIPDFSDALLLVEIPEPEPIEEPETTENGEIEENIVEDVPLTQEEIDALKASATTEMAQRGIAAYEEFIKTGQCDLYGDGLIATKVVGKPGDTSWRQMTDEEAQDILEKDPYNLIANAELTDGAYNVYYNETVYYDPYLYMKDVNSSNEGHVLSGETRPFELVNPEVARRGYKESGFTDEEIDKIFAEIQAEYDQRVSQMEN